MTRKKKIRVAIYSGEIPSTTFIERLIRGLAEKGHTIFLFGEITKKVSYGKNVVVSGYKGKINKLWQWIKWSVLLGLFQSKDKKKLDAILKERFGHRLRHAQVKAYPFLWYKPDIVHIQWAKNLEDWMWVKEFGMKVVLSLRGAHINYSPLADPKLAQMYERNFPKVDGFHAVCRAIGVEAEKYGADPNTIRVVYSGLDLKDFPWQMDSGRKIQNSEFRIQDSGLRIQDSEFLIQETGSKEPHPSQDPDPTFPIVDVQPPIQNSEFRILSIGRAHWKKGYHFALNACKILKDKGMKFQYTIIGGAGDEELLFQRHQLRLENEVELLGRIPFDQVLMRMKEADLFFLPSVEEGIANVVLESMALGTPVLTTDCGGMTETVRDGENGWVVPIRDVQAMAEKILWIANYPDEVQQILIQKARETIEEQHTIQRMVKDFERLFEEI